MIARRSLFALAALVLPAGAARAADPAKAAAFVQAMLDELLAVANGAGTLATKQPALARIIEARVDIAAVAQFCLGRFWRTASPAQRAEYSTLFQRVLIKNIAARVGEYQGVTYSMVGTKPRADDIAVATIVNRPGNAPNKVDWVIVADGAPKVIDVIAEGTSLRLTQRSDYAAYLARNANSVAALIEALRQQDAAS